MSVYNIKCMFVKYDFLITVWTSYNRGALHLLSSKQCFWRKLFNREYILTYLRKDKCFTNEHGPEVFQKCAPKWVAPNEKLNKWGDGYKYVQEKCTHVPPPSSYNTLCKAYYDKVESLR